MRKSRECKNYFFKTIAIVTPVFMALFFTYSIVSSNASVNKTLDLSQKQLILLSNYVYFDGTEELVTVGDYLDSLKKDGVYDPTLINAPDSGIKDSDAIKMFKEIEKDETLRNLVAIGSIDKYIRSVAFVNSSAKDFKDSDAVIVYQGTKGLNEPWLDNLEGAYYTDTDLQKIAGRFYDNVEKTYNITYVTGHSKGGNLAQYVTITRGENVKKCVSFDGQGFSQMFIDKYKGQILNNNYKITSICSYKEPVNALLTPIASRIMYIKTDENADSLSSHISSLLYNESFFTENGIYKESCLTTPTKTVKAVSKICSYVVNNMNTTTLKTASESITPILGYAMPLMMNAASYEDKSLLEALCIELSEKYDNNKELSSQNTTN